MTHSSQPDEAAWKQRFRARKILGAELARANPERGVVVTKAAETYQTCAWDVQTGQVRALTNHPEGKFDGVIAPDGSFVYYHDDRAGNEIGHFVRVPFEGGAVEDITPDLSPFSPVGLVVSRVNDRLAYSVAVPEGFRTYGLDLKEGDRQFTAQLLFQDPKYSGDPRISADGQIVVVQSTRDSDGFRFSLYAMDAASGNQIGELSDGAAQSVEARAFSPVPGDPRLLATTDRTGASRPLIWNVRTGERTELEIQEITGDLLPLDWSPDARRVLLLQFTNARHQLWSYELDTHVASRLNAPHGSFGMFGGGSGVPAFFASEGEIFAHWQDAAHPSQVIALDAVSGEKTRTVLPAGEVAGGRAWRSVQFPSSDGTLVQGWLATPEGAGPFPLIFETHGGPASVTVEHFDARAQTWLDHGFAFFSLNYRGSTSFGKEFSEKIWRDLGHWEIEDMTAAREFLVQEGIAQPDAILLTGWSYGGYLTLLALGKTPALWAGGMAGIAIADWAMMYEDESEVLRGYQRALFGGTPQETPELHRTASPITYVENVRAPILILQGRNDTRTPARQVEAYEKRLRELGKEMQVVWFEAGHLGPFLDADLQIAHTEQMLDFARRVVG